MSTSFTTFNPGDLIEDTHIEQFIEPIQNLESGKTWYGQATGSVNAFEVELDPAPAAYTAGLMVHFKANNNVSGPATVNVNSLGAKALLKEGGATLTAGDIVDNQMLSAVYDGAEFRLLSSVMNPTVNVSPSAENVLVYSEVAKFNPGSAVNLSLPAFDFDSAKSYLMELTLQGGYTPAARVTLSDGSSSYDFPSASTTVSAGNGTGEAIYNKVLTGLSGIHTVTVNTAEILYAEVKFYELNDNLVYADFTPSQVTSSYITQDLADFVAVSGHRYLLTMRLNNRNGTAEGACYLTDGVNNYGIPSSGPTVDFIATGYYFDHCEVSKILTGLAGSYDVKVRGRYHSGVSVQITDIT